MKIDQQFVLEQVKKAIAVITGRDASEIQNSARFVGDLKLESIDIADFSFELENLMPNKVNFLAVYQQAKVSSPVLVSDITVEDAAKLILTFGHQDKK